VTLSYVARSEETAQATVAIHALSADGALLGSQMAMVEARGKELEPGRIKMELPRGTEELAVLAYMSGEGKAWFDEFVLEGK
jgi:hypothetical protein